MWYGNFLKSGKSEAKTKNLNEERSRSSSFCVIAKFSFPRDLLKKRVSRYLLRTCSSQRYLLFTRCVHGNHEQRLSSIPFASPSYHLQALSFSLLYF
uniref:Uncharacterized protein n=1 Tax=Glycine max TaxID=3847 RepID=C6T3B6_SOYBN|nr:unknown [Glycine max]